MHHPLNIITALHCEARPLIDHYQLQSVHTKPFTIYCNRQRSIHLIISGISSIASSAATAYLHAFLNNQPHTAYLNVGIAGSAQHDLGTAVYIDKLIDSVSQQHYYPFILANTSLTSGTLATYAQPQLNYPNTGLVDMEGTGFFVTAKRCTQRELVQIIKIISDTPITPVNQVNAKQTTHLISQALTEIDSLVEQLIALLTIAEPMQSLDTQLTQHFTTYQRHQLNELLRRWHVVCPNRSLPIHTNDSAPEILAQLTEALDTADYSW